MTDTFTYTPVRKTADGRPAAGTRWQWQRQTVGSIFVSQVSFETWQEAEEAAVHMARINRGKFVVSGAEIARRATIRQMCDADGRRSQADGDDVDRLGWNWLRDVITIEDVLSGAPLYIPQTVYNDVDGYDIGQIDGRW